MFRLDWFDLFLNFMSLMLIVVALFTKVIHQVTICSAFWPVTFITSMDSSCLQHCPLTNAERNG